MENQNNNNDNLFTQMFGLESEQPKEVVTEPVTVPETNPIPEQTPQIPTEPVVIKSPEVPQNELTNALNFNNNNVVTVTQPTEVSNTQNEVMTLAPTTKAELEERTTPQTEPEPVVEEVRFNPNAISSTPTEYVPTNFQSYEATDMYVENTTQGKYFLKLILIIIGVAALIGGWFVFYTNVLKEDNDKQAEQVEQTKKEESETEEEQEIPEQPIVYPIEFDENLTFFHSLTTNENELYQTEPYTPEKSTGVIACANIQPYVASGIAMKYEYYLYYEDYKLKKTIVNEISVLSSADNYDLLLGELRAIQQAWADKEGIKVKVEPYPDLLAIHTITYFNLAYGNYFVTDRDSNIFYRLKYNYNDEIRSTMGTLFGNEIGNLVCSSVITTADATANNEI